jgi:putative addiction module component (TIGR02574 family)
MDELDPAADPEYAEAWTAELVRRMRELDSGEVKELSWDEARQVIRRGGDESSDDISQ